jgi:hypothetical protein
VAMIASKCHAQTDRDGGKRASVDRWKITAIEGSIALDGGGFDEPRRRRGREGGGELTRDKSQNFENFANHMSDVALGGTRGLPLALIPLFRSTPRCGSGHCRI